MNCHILKLVSIAVCLSHSAFFASAQCPDSAALNITATLYTRENGLSSDMLNDIAKDSTGYRYFLGADLRWIRYDGVNFSAKTYPRFSFDYYGLKSFATDTYTDQYVGNIHYKFGKDKDGKVYKWGLDGDSLIWVHVPENKREAFPFPKELSTISTPSFFPDGEVCWVTTRSKVFRFDILSKKFLAITLPGNPEMDALWQEPLFMFFRPDGTSYLLMREMILKLNSTSLSFEKLYTIPQLHSLAALPEIIMDTFLYLAERNAIIDEVNLKNGSVYKLNLAHYSSIKNSSALKITSIRNYHDYLLIGTFNAGLFIFNHCTRSMQHFLYEKQGSPASLANSVELLGVDENVIWMQTEAGLIKLEVNNQQIKTFLPSSAEPDGLCNNCNNVRAIYTRDSNNLLIGSWGGVYNFNLNSGRFSNLISPVDGKPVWNNHLVSAVTGDGNGTLFIGAWTNDGILLLNNQRKKLVNILNVKDHPDFSYSYLHCLFYDSHHALWAGTREGFLRITNLDDFEKNDFRGKLTISNQFSGWRNRFQQPNGTCFAITEDVKGNIWMGTVNGLYIYNYKTDSVIRYVHVPGDGKSISDNEVRSIFISKDGDVWIGTLGGGLNHFNLSTKTFTAFTTENGLPNNSIYTILEDHSGFLWLGTNGGLCRFSKTDYSVRNYTPRDGIQNFEFNTNAVAETRDGRFCFGGRTGFNIFHPDSVNVTFPPPKVVITQFKIFDKEFPVPGSVLHLAHNQNSFTFGFAALNYFRSNENQYAYMMEGADKDWVKAGSRQYTSYNNLSPGTYTFKVRAANYTGLWNKGVTSMEFIISPAWYNTWLFRFVLVLLIATGIYSLYRYRLSQVLKLQSLRNRIASDLHDEIGSTLSSISLSSTIIQNKLNGSSTEVTKLLQQISNNTDTMMEALSDIVWAINTRNDRFTNVVNRMRAFAIEILEPSDINVEFNVSEDVLNIQLNMQQRKNLYLIFKEAVNNIAKYAGCKNVYVNIDRQGYKTFTMNIKDDGKGFAIPVDGEEKSLSGNGIRNMKKRTAELGGEVIIESSCGNGTTLNLDFTI